MVPTYGLTHINLAVADAERSLRFYRRVFGARETYREPGVLMAQTPGYEIEIWFE
jgi:catechol 2,3-dioxygenase-like lactoylglutathione lyase family enzyme